MEILQQKITIENSCSIIGKAKDPFSPIKEAFTNSLDAIVQRQDTGVNFIPQITLSMNFSSETDLVDKTRIKYNLLSVSICDNGLGFVSKNHERFKDLGEKSKGLNNRGTGKIQIFCRFRQIDIESVYYEDAKWKKLKATWKKNGEYSDNIINISNETDTKTCVTMSGLLNEKENDYFAKYVESIDNLKRDVLKHFLLRMWLGSKSNSQSIKIEIKVDNQEKSVFVFNKDTIPSPDKEDKIKIRTEQADIKHITSKKIKIDWLPVDPVYELSFHRFKLAASDINQNGVYLCSKNIVVEPFNFTAIKKDSEFEGYRYISCVSGELLNNSDSVNQMVEGFNFPSKKQTEKEIKEETGSLFNTENKYVFWDEIKEKIDQSLEKNYSDIQNLKENREKDIAKIAEKYGISIEIAEVSDIEFNDTEEEIIEKLFQAQARKFAKENMEIRQTYEELKSLEMQKLNPSSKDYKEKFESVSQKLMNKIPQQNKDELARYIIRRDMVVKLLELARRDELEIQREWKEKKARGEMVHEQKEAIFHDLIFRRKMKGVPNDLWILNEEFVHFDGYSDIPLEDLVINEEKLLADNVDIYAALKSVGINKETYLQQRPDIFLFPEESKCVLIEFKSPTVDLSQHTDQIARYATLIANYSRKPKQFTQFFGFLIGEEVDLINLDRSLWKKVPFGNYRIYPNRDILSIGEIETPIASLYQEMIPYSEIATRAKLRNKSFAEKLGISEEELERIQDTTDDELIKQ